MKNLQNSVLTITMAIGLAITGLTPANAVPTPKSVTEVVNASTTDTTEPAISVLPTVLTFEHTTISTAPAPAVEAPVEVVQPTPSKSVSTAASAPVAPVPAPAPVAPASGGAIVGTALAQLGVPQDCTALVTKSIAAVGIQYHGWPAGYFSLGKTVPASAAQPGDLAYYANGGMGLAHIAVYIGGGKAVHGGWNGGTTALASVNVGSGPVFIRVI